MFTLFCPVLDRPGLRGVVQAEEGAEQFAFLHLLHSHQLQHQKSSHQPQDVFMGPQTYTTHMHNMKRIEVCTINPEGNICLCPSIQWLKSKLLML